MFSTFLDSRMKTSLNEEKSAAMPLGSEALLNQLLVQTHF